MDHRRERSKAVSVYLAYFTYFASFAALLPLLAALGACAGAISQDPPDPTDPIGGPDASTDAPEPPPPDAAPDAPADAPADAYNGVIGTACVTDTDCGVGYRCQTTVPGGYCVANCASDVPCPEGTVCSPLPYSRVTGVCMLPCASTADCRPEYVCDIVELFPGDPNSPKSPVPVCWEPWDKDAGGGGGP